jgi:hypothetical protein
MNNGFKLVLMAFILIGLGLPYWMYPWRENFSLIADEIQPWVYHVFFAVLYFNAIIMEAKGIVAWNKKTEKPEVDQEKHFLIMLGIVLLGYPLVFIYLLAIAF